MLGRPFRSFDLAVGQDQGERRRPIPRDREHTALDRELVAALGHDRQRPDRRRIGGGGFSEEIGARLGKQRIHAAGRFDRSEALVAAPFKEVTVGVKKLVVPVYENADRDTVEQHLLNRRFGAWRGQRGGFGSSAGKTSAALPAAGDASCGLRRRAVNSCANSRNARRSMGLKVGGTFGSAGGDGRNGTTLAEAGAAPSADRSVCGVTSAAAAASGFSGAVAGAAAMVGAASTC